MSTVIKEYSFDEIGSLTSDDSEKIRSFTLSSIEEEKLLDPKVLEGERRSSEKNDFFIDDHVEKHRGIVENRLAEQRKKITDLVEREIKIIKKKTVADAFEEGVERANKEVWEKESGLIDERLERLDDLVSRIESFREDVLKAQESKFLDIICSITKWVTKKENIEAGYLSELVKRVIQNEANDQRVVFHYSKKLNDVFQDELDKIKNHYDGSRTISFLENPELTEDDFEIELDNKFIQIGPSAQVKMIDEIFNSLKESNEL